MKVKVELRGKLGFNGRGKDLEKSSWRSGVQSSCDRGGQSIDDGVFAAKYWLPVIVDDGLDASVVCSTVQFFYSYCFFPVVKSPEVVLHYYTEKKKIIGHWTVHH